MTLSAPYRVERSTRISRYALPFGAAAFLVLASLPAWAGAGQLRLLSEIGYYLALAEAWNLLAGYAGLVSVGQQAFVGLGGYALFLLTMRLGVPPLAAVPLAGMATAVVAMPTAFIVFRLRGAYFAIGTWVVAEVFRLLLAVYKPLGGGSGMSLTVAVMRQVSESRAGRDAILYDLSVGLGVGSVLLAFLWLRSRQGLALTALRDSEAASASVGVDNERTKFAVYVVAALLTGCAGALIFLTKLRISPDAAFSVLDWTADVIFIVVIGGIGSIEGPILGTIVFFALRALLADYGAWYLIILGLVAVLVMLLAPRGLWGVLAARFGIQIFPVQRRLRLLDAAALPPVLGPPSGGA